ncbi:uncharacterized protein [Primulina eburnea]|uniref:uncharacterized protein n=1 Tax=Primulina eburnea TaxID=1245227 RepID=UPI003C6BFAF6
MAASTGCFGMRGRCVHPQEHRKAIKLVKCDGEVRIYDRPIKAGELMDEFPKHMVCRFDCFYIGQKIPALPQHHRLQPGHNYFLLPANIFQSTFTFASFLRCSSKFGAAAFQIEKTPGGSLRIKLSEEYGQQQEVLDAGMDKTLIITTPQLRKDYEQLVVLMRRNQWKPKLDTIVEKKSKYSSRSKRIKTRKKESSVLL